MLKQTYRILRPIDALCGQKHIQIAAGPYETTDADTQRFLSLYPAAQFVSESDVPKPEPLSPEASLALYGRAPEGPQVVNAAGVQMKQRTSDRWTSH